MMGLRIINHDSNHNSKYGDKNVLTLDTVGEEKHDELNSWK